MTPADLVGAEADRLSLHEMLALAGKWIAMEVYDRDIQPVRKIAAVGDSAVDCMRQLAGRGLDTSRYECILFRRPSLR